MFNFNLKKFSKNSKLYLCAIFFFYISCGAFGLLQGIYIKELKIDESFLGFILSIKIFATAAASIPCAIFVNKFGKKKGILLSMLLVPLLGILQGCFTNKWYLFMFSFLQGGATAFLTVSDGPFIMENSSEKNRLKLFSYCFSDNVFSTMLGYYIFGHVSKSLCFTFNGIKGLQYAIIISGIIGLFANIFVLSIKDIKENAIIQSHTDFYKDIFKIFKQKNPRMFIIYNSIIGFGAGLVVPYFNIYLKYKVNITTDKIGLIMSLAQGAVGIGALLTPLMAKKFGRVKTIITCQIISIPFLMLIALPPSIIIVSIALFVRNALMNMTGPLIGSISMEIIKEHERSTFASINNIANNLSRALSAVVAGFIMHNFANGYELPYFITAIMYIIATVMFYKCFIIMDKKATKVLSV